MPQDKKIALQDVLSYQIEQYFSADDIEVMRHHFQDPKLFNVLRKALLPTMVDPGLPMELMDNDVWMTKRDWSAIPEAEVKSIMVGRQEAIKFIGGGFMRIKQLISQPDESPEQRAKRLALDSAK